MTRSFADDFGPFDGRVWLNCAHQGPLPRAAVTEAYEAISWKISPHHLNNSERFTSVPRRLKQALGRLINAPAEDIILGNSASYGLHLLANGIPWQAGDEVLLVRGDFPSDILPWLALEERGVSIRFIDPKSFAVEPEELSENITRSTKLLCTTWVNSFTGGAVDVRALGEICRSSGVLLVLNCSQALGARALDISSLNVDAVISVGFKWLCGPYGTGFCWMKPDLRESLTYNQAYWLAMQTADDLTSGREPVRRKDVGARKYDVFGTANFFNFKPWAASVEYLLEQGIERIVSHNDDLVSRLLEGLDSLGYEVLSPKQAPTRSTLVLASHKEPARNRELHEKLKRNGVEIALRAGNLRIAPHLYNTDQDIDRFLSLLN